MGVFSSIKAYMIGIYSTIRESIDKFITKHLKKEIMYCLNCGSTDIIVWYEGVWATDYNSGELVSSQPTSIETVCNNCSDYVEFDTKEEWRW